MNVWNVIRMKMDKNAWASPDAPYHPPILLYIRKVIFCHRSKDKEKKGKKMKRSTHALGKRKMSKQAPPFHSVLEDTCIGWKERRASKHLAQVLEQKLNCCFLSTYLGLWSIYIYLFANHHLYSSSFFNLMWKSWPQGSFSKWPHLQSFSERMGNNPLGKTNRWGP